MKKNHSNDKDGKIHSSQVGKRLSHDRSKIRIQILVLPSVKFSTNSLGTKQTFSSVSRIMRMKESINKPLNVYYGNFHQMGLNAIIKFCIC